MSNCKRFRSKGGVSFSKMEDSRVRGMIHTHQQPDFWEKITDPDQYAYVRWWATVCRREARKRGLL